jgi:hypothetical protein
MPGSTHDIDLKNSIAKTLLYYDIFSYPLKAEEVYRYLDRNSVTIDDVSAELDKMCIEKIIFKIDDFYTVRENAGLVERRLLGNKLARESMPAAKKKAKLIAAFPFVRAVLASGSLSKDYMDEKSDLDFFIIVARKRVWIARMILVLYKRLFLGNSHKLFCINYFIDEEHLEIEEQNIFTATELASIVPLYSRNLYSQLVLKNESWLKKFFPNYCARQTDDVIPDSETSLKRILEGVLNVVGANAFEKICMRLTLAYWRRRYWNKLSKEDFEIAFKSKEYVSKNHPRNFQKRVVAGLAEKMEAFQLNKHEVEI